MYKKGEKGHSAIESMSLAFFLEKNLFKEEKLLRLAKRLLGESPKWPSADAARGGISASPGDRPLSFGAGDTTPSRLETDPLGVEIFLLGNKANWAWGEDTADANRGEAPTDDTPETPETDEYAESLPVSGGLDCPFESTDSGASIFSSEDGIRRCSEWLDMTIFSSEDALHW